MPTHLTSLGDLLALLPGCNCSSRGCISCPIPFRVTMPLHLLPYSQTHIILPCEEEVKKLKVYPILQEALWDSSKEEHCLSDPILLMMPFTPIFQLTFSFSLQQDDSLQTEEGPSPRLTLQLQHVTSEPRWQKKWISPSARSSLA